jgi:glycosyltransferase involved in cell wall biosynthesis
MGIFTNDELAAHVGGGARSRLILDTDAAGSRWGRIRYDQWRVYNLAKGIGLPWLFLPKGYASFVRRCPVKLACYVHDAMQEHYKEYHPGYFPRFESMYFRRAFAATVKSANVIFTNSEFTKSEVRRVARRHGWRTPEVRVAGIGMKPPMVKSGERRTGIVVLSSRLPHKRTDLAVEYLHRWQSGRAFSEPVHWVGSIAEELDVPAHSNWEWHPRMEEATYRGLLARSRALVYFSEYEGFGMPPVEAAIAGVSPVFSDIPACQEAMLCRGFPFANEAYESFSRSLNAALAVNACCLERWGGELLKVHNWECVAERVVVALVEPYRQGSG